MRDEHATVNDGRHHAATGGPFPGIPADSPAAEAERAEPVGAAATGEAPP
jgi:hypothetical protein